MHEYIQIFTVSDIMKKALQIYSEVESDVMKFYIGPKLYVGLGDPRDIEVRLQIRIIRIIG